jgi:hypothetical protein
MAVGVAIHKLKHPYPQMTQIPQIERTRSSFIRSFVQFLICVICAICG